MELCLRMLGMLCGGYVIEFEWIVFCLILIVWWDGLLWVVVKYRLSGES